MVNYLGGRAVKRTEVLYQEIKDLEVEMAVIELRIKLKNEEIEKEHRQQQVYRELGLVK